MASVEDDDLIQAFAPNRADHPLDISVLPRGARCRNDLCDPHRFDSLAEVGAIRPVAIAEQVARSWVPRKTLQLPAARAMLPWDSAQVGGGAQ